MPVGDNSVRVCLSLKEEADTKWESFNMYGLNYATNKWTSKYAYPKSSADVRVFCNSPISNVLEPNANVD